MNVTIVKKIPEMRANTFEALFKLSIMFSL